MTSVSIRGTLNNHRRQGKFIGAFACYGYMKNPDDNHKLIIDDEAAEVVRMIFQKFIGGMSLMGITKELNALGIPNPTVYKQQKGLNFHARNGKNDGLWCDRTVRRILQNQMYIGNMVQGVNKTVSYKVHECKAVPKDDWIIVVYANLLISKQRILFYALSKSVVLINKILPTEIFILTEIKISLFGCLCNPFSFVVRRTAFPTVW